MPVRARTGEHDQIRETTNHDTEVGHRTFRPLVTQPATAGPPNIDLIECTGKRVEASGIHNDIELERPIGRVNAGRCYAHYWRFGGIHELYVVAVIRLEVTGLERHTLNTEAVVFRNQFLGNVGIVNPLANTISDISKNSKVILVISLMKRWD